jgi:hypothetical protein
MKTKELTISPTSPVPKKEQVVVMTFGEMIALLVDSALSNVVRSVRRPVWEEGEYAFIENEKLMLHRGGTDHQWILSVPDLTATDYEVCNCRK